MNAARLFEFFQSDGGLLSMTRLLMFLSFWPASYVMIVNATAMNNESMLLIYTGTFVLGYVGGKGADAYAQRGGKE